MKTKFAMLLALAALVVGGNARAGVVGLSTTSVSSSGSFSSDQTVVSINFHTTGLSGNKFTGISFVGLGSYMGTLTAVLTKVGGSPTDISVSILTYSTPGGIINFDTDAHEDAHEIGSFIWDANSQYNLIITTDGNITGASVNNSSGITNSIPDWIYSPVGGAGDVAVTLYAAVPEPGTMILTGTALAAGAVGAYFKRRRKAKAEVAA